MKLHVIAGVDMINKGLDLSYPYRELGSDGMLLSTKESQSALQEQETVNSIQAAEEVIAEESHLATDEELASRFFESDPSLKIQSNAEDEENEHSKELLTTLFLEELEIEKVKEEVEELKSKEVEVEAEKPSKEEEPQKKKVGRKPKVKE